MSDEQNYTLVTTERFASWSASVVCVKGQTSAMERPHENAEIGIRMMFSRKNKRGGGPGLPASPFVPLRGKPAGLTEVDQPVCVGLPMKPPKPEKSYGRDEKNR